MTALRSIDRLYLRVRGHKQRVPNRASSTVPSWVLGILFFFSSFSTGFSQAPAWAWVQAGNNAAIQNCHSVVYDTTNSLIYSAGDFNSSLTLDGNTINSNSFQNCFLAQMNPLGQVNWLLGFTSSGNAHISDIDVNDVGEVFIIGDFTNSISFPTSSAPLVLNSNGARDIFVVAFAPNGQAFGGMNIGGLNDDYGFGVTAGPNFNFICGSFSGTVNFPGGGGSRTSTGGRDGFIARINPVVTSTQWVRQGSSTGDVYCTSLENEGSNVYATGSYNGNPLSFQNFASPALPNLGQEDVFVVKYSQNGNPQWINRMGGTGPDLANKIAVCPQGAFITGSFQGNSTLFHSTTNLALASNGADDLFLAAYDLTTGDPDWALSEGSTGMDRGLGVDADNLGNLFVSGIFSGNVTMGGVDLLSSNAMDGLIAHYNSSGAYQWTAQIGGVSDEVPADLSVFAGEIVVGGFLSGQGLFFPFSPTYGGAFDAFVANLGCPNPSSPSYIGIAGNDTSTCGDTLILNGQLNSGWNGTWSVLSGSAQLGNPNSPNSQVWFTAADTSLLEWAIQNGPCTVYDTVQIINYSIIPANGGIDRQICGDSLVMQGSNPLPGMGMWAALTGSGVFAAPMDSNSLVTNLSPGPNLLIWKVDNGSCSSSDTILVTTSVFVPADAGNDTTICGTTAPLSGNINPLVTSAAWTLVSGSGSITNPPFPNTTVTNLAPGPNQFAWTVFSGLCSDSDTITISSDELPTPANTGPDLDLCATSSHLLSATSPTVGTGTWTAISSGLSFGNPNLANTTVSGLVTGPNSMEWRVDNGVCPSSYDTLQLTVYDSIPAFAGIAQNFCDTFATTLAASDPGIGTGQWGLVQGSGLFSAPMDSNSNVGALSPGLNQLTWTITNGPCISIDTVDITVDTIRFADAGPDQTLCNTTSTVLAGNATGISTGLWSILNGSGTVTNPGNPISALSGLNVGISELEWSLDNGSCPTTRDTVNIEVLALLTAVTGPDQSLCQSTNSILSANNPGAANGNWTQIAGSGNVANPNDSSSAVSGLATGQNIFVWTVSNGICPSVHDTLVIEVFDSIPADAGNDTALCDSLFTDLQAFDPSPGQGLWSVFQGSGSFANPGDPLTTISGLSSGLNQLVWTVSNGPCISSDTLGISVTLLNNPANAGPDQSLCDSFLVSLSGSGNGSGTWSLVSGTGSIANPLDSNAIVSNLSLGSNSFAWTVFDNACMSSDTVVVQVDPQPSQADAGADQSLCEAQTGSLNALVPTQGTAVWTSLGAASVDQASLSGSDVSGLVPGDNAFVWSVSSGVCPASTDTVLIQVVLAPLVDAGLDQSLCDTTGATLSADSSPGTGLWMDLGGNLNFSDPMSPSSEVTNLQVGSNVLVWSKTNGPCQAEDTMVIDVSSPPSAAQAGGDQEIAQPLTSLEGVAPTTGTGTWSVLSGAGTFSDLNSPIPDVTGIAIGLNEYVWTISSGACPVNSDTVRVNLIELVIPTGFSPNGDGRNDTWVIRGVQSYGAEVTVFNRWGNLVYEASNYNNDWDGRSSAGGALADDTYYFVIKLGDGRNFNGFVVIKR